MQLKARSYILLTLMWVACGLLPSCMDDDILTDIGDVADSEALIITSLPSTTRADGGHIDTSDPFKVGNEDLINTAELYFFTDGQSTEKAIYHYSLSGIDNTATAKLRLKMPIDKLSKFTNSPADDDNKRMAYVYAIVNLPPGVSLPADDDATLENLESIWVSTDDFGKKAMPANFVMRGGGVVTLEGEGRDAVIKGCVPVERLASKIRLFAKIQSVIYLDEDGKVIPKPEGWTDEQFAAHRPEGAVEEWHPLPNSGNATSLTPNTWVFMTNYTRRAQINGGITDSEDDYMSINRITTKDSQGRNMVEGVNIFDYSEESTAQPIQRASYPYTHELAYYSYPNQWDSSDILETHASAVTMRLTWTRVWDKETNGGNQLFGNFYYQIPVNRLKGGGTTANDCLQPNMYYRIKVDIGMLGNKDLGTPLEIDASYEAIPWVNEPVDVNIKGQRYLVVNETEWTMNNSSFISIPFSTSHPVDIEYCYVNYFRYNEKWGTDYDSREYNYTENWWGAQTLEWKNSLEHNSDEFKKWLDSANAAGLKGKRNSEGRITAQVDKNLTSFSRLLYYKDSYFYDSIYDDLEKNDNQVTTKSEGYRYYVGHEKPYTFQRDYVTGADYTVRPKIELQGDMKRGWDLFEQIYQTDTIYTCHVNNKDRLITFSNPLVLWKDTILNGQFMYYPELSKLGKLRDQFSRIEVTIKIKHADWTENDLFSEIIHITQYPGMYIEVNHNYGKPRYVHNGNTSSTPTRQNVCNQYVLVNGNTYQSTHNANYWDEVNIDQLPSFAGNNCNPNMYVIHTTQLSEDNPNYIIGDPRSIYYNCMLRGYEGKTTVGGTGRYNLFIDNTKNIELEKEEASLINGSWNWIGRTASGGRFGYYYVDLVSVKNVGKPGWKTSNATQQMLKYYPTDETQASGSKINFVAPVFRIASSFGKVVQNYLEPGRRRCAAYQEAGRPAGRWRLPTKAEIEYIATLSADGKIPVLFGNTADRDAYGRYWSANGPVDVNAKGDVRYPGKSNEDEYSPRCVYDEWYWTIIDKAADYTPWDLETNFYWGDIEKDNTQQKIRSLWGR